MFEQISATFLANLLQGDGLRGQVEVDEDGDQYVASGNYGFQFRIFLEELSHGSTRLNFRMVTWLPADDAPRVCNEFNMKYVSGKAWHFTEADQDGDVAVIVQFVSELTGGVSENWIRSELSTWDVILAAFQKILLESQ